MKFTQIFLAALPLLALATSAQLNAISTIEAEAYDASSPASPWEVQSDEARSFMVVPSAPFLSPASDSAAGQLRYPLTVTSAGSVSLSAVVNFLNNGDNSFYTKLEGHSDASWQAQNSFSTSGNWENHSIRSWSGVAAGDYTLVVLYREDGSKIDSLSLDGASFGESTPVAPEIETHPVGLTVDEGTDVVFTVVATGDELSYQWNLDGVAISGATEDTLSLPGVSSADAGTYTVSISSSGGEVTSDPAELVVHPLAVSNIYLEQDGLVVMEAENFTDGLSSAGGQSWAEATATTGYVGAGYMNVPEAGASPQTFSSGSRLNYDILFETTGTYHVWVRRSAADWVSDSAIIGFEGLELGDRIDNSGSSGWIWVSTGQSFMASEGVQSFNLVQREDGYKVDRIVLSTNPSYPVSGAGPEESTRGDLVNSELEPSRVYLEAEAAENKNSGLFAPFAVVDETGASGGQYLVWPGSGSQDLSADETDPGQAIYTLEVPTDTNRLSFWAKVRFPNAGDNSFFYRLQGNGYDSGWVTYNSVTSSEWTWFSVGNFADISAGTYTFTLLKREDGAAVDQLYFTWFGTDPRIAEGEIPQLVATGAEPQLVSDAFTFTEGPAVDANGDVYFTDISGATSNKWTHADNSIALFRSNTGRANGQYIDAFGQVIAGEIDTSRVTSADPVTGAITVLTDTFGGNPYNSPNDLWIDANGGIYFTDPNYEGSSNEDQGGRHVYYISPDRATVTRVIDSLNNPNGIVGTSDGSTLYVVDSPRVYTFDIGSNGSVSNQQLFAETPGDGMTLDALGNVYVCGGGAVNIFNPDGYKLREIVLPRWPANLCFAGPDRKTLFLTCRKDIYTLQMAVPGIE